MIVYDSWDSACKQPFGAVKTNEKARFSVRFSKRELITMPMLKIREIDSHEIISVPMSLSGVGLTENYYSCEFESPKPAVYVYYFEFSRDGALYTIKRNADGKAVVGDNGGLWQLTVYDRDMKAPAFLREGVLYQIFPDRFAKSGEPKENVPGDRVLRGDWGGMPEWRPDHDGEVLNNDYFGGDLKGIEQKLEYLAKLGVTAIYLNPVFEAHSNHRYNTANYENIDPLLGTNADFERLAKAAKDRGISLILDGVFSHTGSDSVYFNKNKRYGEGGAYHDENSPYREWYSFKHYPDDYDSWWGFSVLPNVNETAPSYLEFICGENGILSKWLAAGASGFRLDVADELPDEFLDALHDRVKAASPDCAVIGEVWEDASNKTSYGVRRRYLLGGQLDSVMNYPFKDAILGYIQWGIGEVFLGTVMQILENYPKPAIQALMNSISTHDTERAITTLAAMPVENHDRAWQEQHHYLTDSDYERGCKLFKLACILQFGLPGIPCVYYGDEAGLSGYRDPFNRCCYPWGYENTELVEFVASLGKVRNDYPIFADAVFLPVTFCKDVCCFVRANGSTSIAFAINRCTENRRLVLPGEFAKAKVLALTGQYNDGELAAYSGVVLLSEDNAKNGPERLQIRERLTNFWRFARG